MSPPKAPLAMNTVMEPPAAIRENPRSFWTIGRKVARLRMVVTLNRTTENKTLNPKTRRFKEDSIMIFEVESIFGAFSPSRAYLCRIQAVPRAGRQAKKLHFNPKVVTTMRIRKGPKL